MIGQRDQEILGGFPSIASSWCLLLWGDLDHVEVWRRLLWLAPAPGGVTGESNKGRGGLARPWASSSLAGDVLGRHVTEEVAHARLPD